MSKTRIVHVTLAVRYTDDIQQKHVRVLHAKVKKDLKEQIKFTDPDYWIDDKELGEVHVFPKIERIVVK